MAIKILNNQIQPSKKSTNTGGITVDTGAAAFGQSVAQFGKTAENAIKQYATVKAQQELKLQAQVADTAIDQSLQQVQQNILNPTGELFTSPQLWEEAYEDEAASILETMMGSTGNKTLQQSMLASWNAAKIKYEKDIVTKSASRVSNMLQGSYLEKFDLASNELTNVDDLNTLQIIADNMVNLFNEYEASGFLKEGETKQSLYEKYIGTAIKDRVLNATADMSMDMFIQSYETRTLGDGDPITEFLIKMLDENDVDQLLDEAFDKKIERLKLINDAENKFEERYNTEVNKNILDMDGEPDPETKLKKREALLRQYQGNDEIIQKINTAYLTDHALVDDPTISLTSVKKDIAFGNTNLDDLVAMKPLFSQETYAGLVELLDNTNSPRSELSNNLRMRLKTEVYGENDGFLEIIKDDDPTLAAMFSDGLATFNAKFENGLENMQSNETPQDVFDKVLAEAKSLIRTRKATTIALEINTMAADAKHAGVTFIIDNIPQTIMNIKASDISNSRKILLESRLQQIQTIYGDDPGIFKLAAGME